MDLRKVQGWRHNDILEMIMIRYYLEDQCVEYWQYVSRYYVHRYIL